MAPSCRYFNALVISAFCLFGLGCERNPTGGSQLGSTIESPTSKGEREAEEAILTGKLVLKQYPPLPYPPGQQIYVRLLKSRCGVESESLPSDYPGDPKQTREEVAAWNAIMKKEIRRQFGDGIFEELEALAQQQRSKTLGKNGTGP